MTDVNDDDCNPDSLDGVRVVLLGRFGGMNQREAGNVVRSLGGSVVSLSGDLDLASVDWVVIGANESPLTEVDLMGDSIREAAARGTLEVLQETELWQRLGLIDRESSSGQIYTPMMLADLLDVSVRVIRRWHRRGLITPVRTLHRLPYFDFQEVTTARRLAKWIASGASPRVIEQRLVDLVEFFPEIQRPLDQLSILVEGREVLLRRGEGLLEPGGQLRFDFELAGNLGEKDSAEGFAREWEGESDRSLDDEESPRVLSFFGDDSNSDSNGAAREALPVDPMLQRVYDAEDDGDFPLAIDLLHILLGRDGPQADLCFQLGELFYRIGDITAARERYYMTIELAPDSVEVRVSLGIVLAEIDQWELAVSAFRGALSLHEDYADAHYQLARILEHNSHDIEAAYHWRRFLALAPESPWADEAIARLETT